MADLMQSLIFPQSSQDLHPASSCESFHSTQSSAQSQNRVEAKAAGQNSCDVANFLNDPRNLALLEGCSKQKPGQYSNGVEPVAIGSHTSQHRVKLNNLCQAYGLPTPEFDIEQFGEGDNARFRGAIRVGNTAVRSDSSWNNKKAAREGLSSEALPAVQKMVSSRKENVQPNAARNWIGLLHQYYQTQGSGATPTYNYYALGNRFSATCSLPDVIGQSFGDEREPFPSKKAAQTNAAKRSVEWLIEKRQLDLNGQPPVTTRRSSNGPNKTDPNAGASMSVTRVNGTVTIQVPQPPASFPQRVAELAVNLGLQAPQYHLSPTSPATSNVLSGYAEFRGALVQELEGPVGQIHNVFGKKNAKEEIARGCWTALKLVATNRGINVVE